MSCVVPVVGRAGKCRLDGTTVRSCLIGGIGAQKGQRSSLTLIILLISDVFVVDSSFRDNEGVCEEHVATATSRCIFLSFSLNMSCLKEDLLPFSLISVGFCVTCLSWLNRAR